MRVDTCAVKGVLLITPEIHRDHRGWFARTFDLEAYAGLGIGTRFVQHNQSRSWHGVIRGLHVRGGRGEAKVVRCVAGTVVDFVVDLRPTSSTFMRTARFRLDADEQQQIYLPPLVAHGYQVVSDQADVAYLHSEVYEPGADLSFAWNDPDLGLDWPVADAIVSARDAQAPRVRDVDLHEVFSL